MDWTAKASLYDWTAAGFCRCDLDVAYRFFMLDLCGFFRLFLLWGKSSNASGFLLVVRTPTLFDCSQFLFHVFKSLRLCDCILLLECLYFCLCHFRFILSFP